MPKGVIYMEFILDLSINLIASMFFLIVLFGMKPKIEISKLIAKSKSYDDKDEYLIKIINKGLYPVINIKAEMFFINKATVHGGFIDEHIRIPLKMDSIMVLNRIIKEAPSDDYTFHFSTRENIIEKLKNDKNLTLRIKILATHSLTNFSKVFIMNYSGIDVIKNNEFCYGDSLEIEEI
jgi:hypothetical protein